MAVRWTKAEQNSAPIVAGQMTKPTVGVNRHLARTRGQPVHHRA
jgi:hypothetical protein